MMLARLARLRSAPLARLASFQQRAQPRLARVCTTNMMMMQPREEKKQQQRELSSSAFQSTAAAWSSLGGSPVDLQSGVLAQFQRRFSSAAREGATYKVPDISTYSSQDHHFDEAAIPYEGGDPTRRTYNYFVLGSARFLWASAVRLLVIKVVSSMSASADVLALSTLEVNLGEIDMGSTITVKWRGKPVFIRRRTDAEIQIARGTPVDGLPDPQKDEERVKEPEWLIVLGVCTHLGCVPISNAGDYKGWFCPCHGSHYDVSGRIRKGPAPLNLEVPEYKFLDGGEKVLIG